MFPPMILMVEQMHAFGSDVQPFVPYLTWLLCAPFSIRSLQPVDATTNPSLILAAVNDPKFADIVDKAIKSAKGETLDDRYVMFFFPSDPAHECGDRPEKAYACMMLVCVRECVCVCLCVC